MSNTLGDTSSSDVTFAQESLSFWWDAQQEWLNVPLSKERTKGLKLCRERLQHFAAAVKGGK